MRTSTPAHAWQWLAGLRRDVVLVCLALAAPPLIHWGVASRLGGRWLAFDQAYSHGLLILTIALWLVFGVLRRHRFVPRPSIMGVVLVALASLMLAFASAVHVEIIQQVALVGMVWALILALVGWRAAFYTFFPVGFMAFAVPIWDFLVYPLQRLTAAVSGSVLSVIDIRFALNETLIRLEDIGTIEVARGCSGLRYLVVALTLAALFSYLSLRRARSWALMLVAAIVLALLTNWVRVAALVLIAYETVMTSPMLQQHELFGWLLFVVALVPLFWLGNRLARRDSARTDASGPERQSAATPVPSIRLGVIGGLCAVSLALPPLMVARSQAAAVDDLGLPAPERVGDWQRINGGGQSPWQPLMRNPDASQMRAYRSREQSGSLFVGSWYYQRHHPGKELVQYANHIVHPDRWERLEQRALRIGAFRGRLLELARVGDADARVVVAYGYHVDGRWVVSPILVKGLQGLAVMLGDPGAGLVAVSKSCATSCESARATVTEFVRSARPLSRWLPSQ